MTNAAFGGNILAVIMGENAITTAVSATKTWP
jgi:hypothetical protein